MEDITEEIEETEEIVARIIECEKKNRRLEASRQQCASISLRSTRTTHCTNFCSECCQAAVL